MFQLVLVLKSFAAEELLISWSENVTSQCDLRNVSQVADNLAPGEAGKRKLVHHLRVVVGTQLQRSRHQQRGSERCLLWMHPWHREMRVPWLCSAPLCWTLQEREHSRNSTAKSGISLQSQCHQMTRRICHIARCNWRDTDTQPLSLTFLHRKAERPPHLGTTQSSAAVCKGTRVSESLGRWCCQHSALVGGMVGCCWLDPHGISPSWELRCCFVMQQPLFQRCPAISDYYGGWKTLLFLTAGSRLNGLKRIFRSCCFRDALNSVAATAQAVCLCFGDCFSMVFVLPCSYKWEAESFFHKCCKPLLPFTQTMQQQLPKRFLSIISGKIK